MPDEASKALQRWLKGGGMPVRGRAKKHTVLLNGVHVHVVVTLLVLVLVIGS